MQAAKRVLGCIFIPLLFVFLSSCRTAAPTFTSKRPVEQLRDSIDKILKDSIFLPARVGIRVISVNDGEALYDRDGEKLFHPASTLKLLTSATALHELGKQFKFKTVLYADSISRSGMAVRNLFVKGFGNPNFSVSDLRWMVEQMKANGIQQVEGDLIGDVSYFDTLYWGKGWMWDDEPSAEEPFITPLSVNKNTVSVFVSPGMRNGDPLTVRLEPETRSLSVANGGTTGSSDSANPLEVTRDHFVRSNTIRVKGTLPISSREREFALSVWRPELFALTLFQEELSRQGISVRGEARIGTLADNAKTIVVHEWPIDSVLYTMNKPSDNLSAENVLKTLSAEKHGAPGTAADGIAAVKAYLTSLGIDSTSYLMVDGSGVSHYNLLSPQIVTTLLAAVRRDEGASEAYYESLPLAGEEGTLKNRMRAGAASRNVRAKTGTLTGVSNLSGYVTTRDGELLAFSIFIEHFIGTPKQYRDAQDKIVELLARFSREGMQEQ
jgi:D-alanyl-D-alanine carboxypeptidase/D-alanyl-D-alanine-endopeptidase (penicillin-binding protein 4)